MHLPSGSPNTLGVVIHFHRLFSNEHLDRGAIGLVAVRARERACEAIPYTELVRSRARRPSPTSVRSRRSMDVALEIHPVGPWTVVEIAGELDMHSAPPVRDRVIGLI